MTENHLSPTDKLNLIKEMNERNKQREKDFAKDAYNEKLFNLYVEAKISREEFERLFKK